MPRVFNLSKFNNLREAINIEYPRSKKNLEQIEDPGERQRLSPLPVIPFQQLVETTLGRKIEQIDRDTVEELKNYYLSIFDNPESIGPAFESVRSLSVDIEPTKKIEQLKAALENLKKDGTSVDVIQMVKDAFGDKPAELQRFKEAVFSKFNLQYDENLIAIFKQRVNANTIPNIAKLFKQNQEQNADNTAIILTASQVKQDYIFAAADMLAPFIDECKSIGLIEVQINWILSHGRDADINTMPFADKDKVNFDAIRKLMYDFNTINTRIGQLLNENPTALFSENEANMKKAGLSDEEISIMKQIASHPAVGGAIIREDYFDKLNLSKLEIPIDSNDLFNSQYDPNLQASREEQIRLNPQNLNLIKSLLEKGGYVVGGKASKRLPNYLAKRKTDYQLTPEQWEQVQILIGQGKNLNFDSQEFPSGSYVDRALWYAANNLCGNQETFQKLIVSSGAVYENEQDGQELVDDDGNPIESALDVKSQMEVLFGEAPLTDDKYGDFNMEHDSVDQKRAIDTLRNSFALETVPSSMGIPALDDCNVNAEGFQVDFIVICSALRNWSESNGQFHPVIDEQVNFVGEYYGFNFDFKKSLKLFNDDGSIADVVIDTTTGKPKKIKRIQSTEGLTMPDGSMAKVKLRRNPGDSNKNKIEVDASFGTPLDAGSEYKIREEWKKMTEDFAATILGNASIHLQPDFNDTDVIQELNRCNIIYKYKGSIVDRSPYMFINNHMSQCQDDNCSSKKTLDSGDFHYFRNYSAKEGIVLAKITEFKMTNGLVPKLREEKNKTAQAKMQFMRKLAEEANTPVAELWSKIPYKEFLDKFHSEHDLSVKGFGRHEIYQYYQEKVILEKQLVDLIKSPSHDYRTEIELRTKIIELKNKHLNHFQEIYDMQTNVDSTENSAYAQTLQKLEEIRSLVASGKDNMTNQQLEVLLDSMFVSYVPQIVAQRRQAINYVELFKIAIQS